jgi:hypothetical protein
MGWVDVLVSNYEESEAPPKFYYWSALAAISAVMKKKTWLERHTYKLYPNIYVFLVAGSGMRKGIPITVVKKIVRGADEARIITGRGSIQRVLQDLGKAKTLQNGGMIKEAQAFMISGELAAFFVKDPDALTILTDLHNTHEHEDFWENSLKSTGVDKLKEPCLTLLGATNEEHFDSAVTQKDVKGGFIARTFIVFSNDVVKWNSLTQKPKVVPDTSYMSLYLKELAKLSGEFVYGKNSAQTYDDWYYTFMPSIGYDPTGTFHRTGDQVLKIAMLLALSECPQLVIKESHILEAIRVCTDCLSGMKQVTMGGGRSNLAIQTKIVMRELLRSTEHQVSKKYLLTNYWSEFTDLDLDRIIETLIAADAIEMLGQGKNVVYKMKRHAVDIFQKAVQGIQ